MINFSDNYTGKKYNFDIIKQTDRNIISSFQMLNSNTRFKINKVGLKLNSGKDFSINLNENLSDELSSLLSTESEIINYFITSVSCGGQEITLQINRHNNEYQFDKLSFNGSYDETKSIEFDILYGELRKRFKAVNSKYALDEGNKLISDFYLQRELDLSKLEGLARELIVNNHKFAQEKEEEYKKETKKFKEDLEKEYEARKKVVDDRAKELEEQKKRIDDRDNKHVRREIRNNLKGVFREYSTDFHLTPRTVRKRFIIHAFSIILLSIFGVGFVYFSIFSMDVIIDAIKSNNYQLLFTLYVKNVLFALGFGSTSVFYIRWNNRWFEQHSNEEFKLKKLEIDIERASWLVELALEWEDNKKEIPVLLIDRLSNNLFNDSENVEEVKLHPADQLASSLLGAASGLKLKTPDGSELSFTKNGLSKLNKTTN